MSSEPEYPHEQLPEGLFVASHQAKPRGYNIFNPGPGEAPSSTQPNQPSTGAEPGNDNVGDGAPGQNRNGGGKVSNP